MNESKYQSLSEIRKDLKVLNLKREISYELLVQNKEEAQNYLKPLSMFNSFIMGPLKKVAIGLALKKMLK